jgi:hypothetical protein
MRHAWERRDKCTRFWWESPKERDKLEDQGVGGIRMNLREIGLGRCGLDPNGSGQGPVAGCCECGDEPSGSYATELVSVWIKDASKETCFTPLQKKPSRKLLKRAFNCLSMLLETRTGKVPHFIVEFPNEKAINNHG